MALGAIRSLTLRLAAAVLSLAGAALAGADERLVHRFLNVEISPDGTRVAAIEGDAAAGASYPEVRELVIRGRGAGAEVRVALPCGRVPQCWPGSPAWTPDGGGA